MPPKALHHTVPILPSYKLNQYNGGRNNSIQLVYSFCGQLPINQLLPKISIIHRTVIPFHTFNVNIKLYVLLKSLILTELFPTTNKQTNKQTVFMFHIHSPEISVQGTGVLRFMKGMYTQTQLLQLFSENLKGPLTNVLSPLTNTDTLNLLKSTGYVMHQQFNIQQMYVLPTLYLCVLHLSENKQRLVPLTA